MQPLQDLYYNLKYITVKKHTTQYCSVLSYLSIVQKFIIIQNKHNVHSLKYIQVTDFLFGPKHYNSMSFAALQNLKY